MKITSIPSVLPSWYDPDMPGFTPPKNWDGCRVRVRVPIKSDPIKEIEAARQRLEKKYPGATLHLVQEPKKTSLATEQFDLKGDDEALLRAYLNQIELPEGVTVAQVINYLQKFLPKLSVFGVQGLKFKTLLATNTLCFESVKLELARTGLTLISAINKDWPGTRSNGGGKTSLVTTPFIALFGRTFKGQTFDGWARQASTQPAKLSLLVDLPDGRELNVIRGRRPNILRVYLDGKEITMGDPNATQALIERLTNLTWDVLTNAVYIGQREIGSVFGTDKERKELFSRLLGLERFLEAQTKLRVVVLRHQQLILEAHAEVDRTEASLQEAESGTVDIKKALEETPIISSADIKNKERQAQSLRNDAAKNEAGIKNLEPQLEENQKRFEVYLGKAITLEERVKSLREQLTAIGKVEGQCPLCGSKVSVKNLEQHENEIRRRITLNETELETWEQKQAQNREARRAMQDSLNQKRLDNDKLRRKIEALEREANSLKEQTDARRKLEEIACQKDNRIQELKRIKTIHEGALKACANERAFAEFCSNVVGRNGLPAYLCSVAAPQLNQAAMRYSQVFAEGEISVSFEISGGDIDIKVINLHGGSGIKDQSAGEMRMAGIIAALAFRDTLVPHNLLILDEPGEGLDPVNAEAFAKGLNSVVERFQHVIVISHSIPILSTLEPDFHLEVVKENGVSTVYEV